MKIAVTTPTGNIGRALTQRLLDAGAEVILLARSPEKVKAFADRGATVHKGDLKDKDFVVRATRGADALFWLTPGDYTTDDFRAYQNRLGDNAVAAVTTNKIPRVVTLSSIGAHLPSGTGPIAGLHDVEKKLDKTGAHVTHLRPGYFMENLFMSAQTIASDGAVFLPLPGAARMAMVATSDIAREAAERLLDTAWTGRSVVELVGPEEITFQRAAETIGSAIGKKVSHVEVTTDQLHEALGKMGISKNVADQFVEMYGAFKTGKVAPESTPVRATTTLDTFAKNVFKPGFEAMTGK